MIAQIVYALFIAGLMAAHGLIAVAITIAVTGCAFAYLDLRSL